MPPRYRKPKDIEAVVDRDHHDVVASREIGAVVAAVAAMAAGETAAVEIDHHRPAAMVTQAPGPDVQEQAVFAHGRAVGVGRIFRDRAAAGGFGLRATRADLRRIARVPSTAPELRGSMNRLAPPVGAA